MTTLRRAKICTPKAKWQGRPWWPACLDQTGIGLLLVGEDVIDSLLNRGDLFSLVVREFRTRIPLPEP